MNTSHPTASYAPRIDNDQAQQDDISDLAGLFELMRQQMNRLALYGEEKPPTRDFADFTAGIIEPVIIRLYGALVNERALQGSVGLLRFALEYLDSVIDLVVDFFNFADLFARRLFFSLFGLLVRLEDFVQIPLDLGDGLTPPTLQQRVSNFLCRLVTGLDRSYASRQWDELKEPFHLRELLSELLRVTEDLTSLAPTTNDIIITFFDEHPVKLFAADDEISDPDMALTLNISPSHIPSFLSVTFDLLFATKFFELRTRAHTHDLFRRAVALMRSTYDSCFRQSSLTAPARVKLLKVIIIAISSTLQKPDAADILRYIPDHLLRLRLEENVALDWPQLELDLEVVLKARPPCPPETSLIAAITQKLSVKIWAEVAPQVKNLICAYIKNVAPRSNENEIDSLRTAVRRLGDPEGFEGLLEYLNQHPRPVHVPPEPADPDTGRMNIAAHTWRTKVLQQLEEIVHPQSLDWMDDDGGFSIREICFRAIGELETRFGDPEPMGMPLETRLLLCEQVGRLVCLLAHCEGTRCEVVGPGNIPLDGCIPLVLQILDDAPDNAKVACFELINTLAKHCRTGDHSDSLVAIVLRGAQDTNRGVRVAAGRPLRHIMESYIRMGDEGLPRIDALFGKLHEIFETSKDYIRETLLGSMGEMARSSNDEVLGQSVCLIITQLGKKNLFIRATANMQILGIAKYHKKSAYNLALPYFNKLAPYIAARLATQPLLFTESCRLFSTVRQDFIIRTLNFTLPILFATCDQPNLQALAEEIGDSIAKILVQRCPAKVLAHIFMLPVQSAMNKAMFYVGDVLNAVANGEVTAHTLCRSVLVPLLVELIISSGDEDPDTAAQAILGLKRMEAMMATGKPTPVRDNLSEFLKNNMLGVITEVSDTLRDVHGRRTVHEKQKIIRSVGVFIRQIGTPISAIASQILTIFQTMVLIPELSVTTLESWRDFLFTLATDDLGINLGPTTAAIVGSWSMLPEKARETSTDCLQYLIEDVGQKLGPHLDDIVDLSTIPELHHLSEVLKHVRGSPTPESNLRRILDQAANDNTFVAIRALVELKSFMTHDHPEYTRTLTTGDVFSPFVGQILTVLYSAIAKEGDGPATEQLRSIAYECVSVLGAVDPDRCDIRVKSNTMVVFNNFKDLEETQAFSLHLICDLLVGVFRSTTDMKYQTEVAFAIQELLKAAGFSPSLIGAGGPVVSSTCEDRWHELPKHILETCTPLLEGRFHLNKAPPTLSEYPIYPTHATTREWIQAWAADLTSRIVLAAEARRGKKRKTFPDAGHVFEVFRAAIRNRDGVIASYLLPHLFLSVLLGGTDDDVTLLRQEMLFVLEQQESNNGAPPTDKQIIATRTIFSLLDHLNKWLCRAREEIPPNVGGTKRSTRLPSELQTQFVRVESLLSSFDQSLTAHAALSCKAYARSLMNFEERIFNLKAREAEQYKGANPEDIPPCPDLLRFYDAMHEIYSQLDEPDGMEGISALVVNPSLEHRIREHESMGRWTAAQNCWEVKVQNEPNNVDTHLGLLRCLRNLGHYNTLRTHVRGLLDRHPEWESALTDFAVQGAWTVGAWDDVQAIVDKSRDDAPSVVMARVLLSLRKGDSQSIASSLSAARTRLGAPIIAAGGIKGVRRSDEAVLHLHSIHELEMIFNATRELPSSSQAGNAEERHRRLEKLWNTLSERLEATLPTFRTREPILSMRRTAFAICNDSRNGLSFQIGRSWLASAKFARKAKQWQTAFSAVLQAKEMGTPFWFVESAKLTRARGEPHQSLQELHDVVTKDNALRGETEGPLGNHLTRRMKNKTWSLLARWMNETDRYNVNRLYDMFKEGIQQDFGAWESAHYHLGRFHDESYKALPKQIQQTRGMKMGVQTVQQYTKAVIAGSKYIYRTVPRIITVWLEIAQHPNKHPDQQADYEKMQTIVKQAIREIPPYKWFTAFPLIVARVGGLTNTQADNHFSSLIVHVMRAYPKQSLWLFLCAVKSRKSRRKEKAETILARLQNNPNDAGRGTERLVKTALEMADGLMELCKAKVEHNTVSISMTKSSPGLKRLENCNLIIPLQESLIPTLPPSSTPDSNYQPFPPNLPTFHEFYDQVDLMKSVARPRKLTIVGSDGQKYLFLGKPKDDLRKDARLMDLWAVINKLFKRSSEARRRQLHIRTYGVISLDIESGFIQWVPHTGGLRPIIASLHRDMGVVYRSVQDMEKISRDMIEDKSAPSVIKKFEKISRAYPPVLHRWFLAVFPEPGEWLSSKLAFSRTAAVILGDRHLENILVDESTGDVVHVDYNVLFDNGRNLAVKELVPFRLTANIIDALGVTGVEGIFRTSCEITLQILRDNKDAVMGVLETLVHDPLDEWEIRVVGEEIRQRRIESLRNIIDNALGPVEKRLQGLYNINTDRQPRVHDTRNLVNLLIDKATSKHTLAKMFHGWTPWL